MNRRVIVAILLLVLPELLSGEPFRFIVAREEGNATPDQVILKAACLAYADAVEREFERIPQRDHEKVRTQEYCSQLRSDFASGQAPNWVEAVFAVIAKDEILVKFVPRLGWPNSIDVRLDPKTLKLIGATSVGRFSIAEGERGPLREDAEASRARTAPAGKGQAGRD